VSLATPADLPPIAAAHCRLRPLQPADAPALQRHADDEGVWRNLFDGFPHPYTLADARAWCEGGWRQGGDVLAIEADLGQGPALVGCIGAQALSAPGRQCNAEVGWWLGRAAWGHGLAADALRHFGPACFAARPALSRLCATIYLRNTASQRVAEKAGWVREGVLPRSIVKAGELLDAALYACYRG
jgi:RimJ/RimL family protein N-acetyltransferase